MSCVLNKLNAEASLYVLSPRMCLTLRILLRTCDPQTCSGAANVQPNRQKLNGRRGTGCSTRLSGTSISQPPSRHEACIHGPSSYKNWWDPRRLKVRTLYHPRRARATTLFPSFSLYPNDLPRFSRLGTLIHPPNLESQ